MKLYSWQVCAPLDTIIFDCDGTLSGVEGITVLSERKGVHSEVHALTEKAMSDTGITSELYDARLKLVQPKASEMVVAARAYWQYVTPDVVKVINCLHALGKTVQVLSAGIQQPVEQFASELGISSANVHAVPIYFNSDGNYQDFDHESKLVHPNGKLYFVQQQRKKNRRIAHIGDGMNDIEVANFVERFVGYGGHYYRESILQRSQFYIQCQSMAPLLPLLLTQQEAKSLSTDACQLYERGCRMIEAGDVALRLDN